MEIIISTDYIRPLTIDTFKAELSKKINKEIDATYIHKIIKDSFQFAWDYFIQTNENSNIDQIIIYLLDESYNMDAGYQLTSAKRIGLGTYKFGYTLNVERFLRVILMSELKIVYHVWVHELIHMLDHKKNPTYLVESTAKRETNHLLGFLTEVKLEGTAQLYKFIFKQRPPLEDCHVFNKLLEKEEFLSYYIEQNGNLKSGNPNRSVVHNFIYGAASWLLIYVIMNSENDEESKFGFDIYQQLCTNDFRTDNISDFKTLINLCINIDISEFLYRLCIINRQELPVIVNSEYLFKSLYENEINPDSKRSEYRSDFLEIINKQEVSQKCIIDLLISIIGSQMLDEEIDEAFDSMQHRMKALNKNDYLSVETLKLTNMIYEIFKNDKSYAKKELAKWILTYVLDDQDLIYDSTRIYGLLDDLIVLKSFFRIIN